MIDLDRVARDAYESEIAQAEAGGRVADERAAFEAARGALDAAIDAAPDVGDELRRQAIERICQSVHKRKVDEGKRRIKELASGQRPFSDLDDLGFVVPLGEGAIATFGFLDTTRVDMADEVQKQNLFNTQRAYQEWSDGIVRPVKGALRTMAPGATIMDAVEQGKL
jgi:hypothetical protein